MAFNSTKNFYEILEVSTDSSCAEIKSAYRRLARKYHPDINKSEEAIVIFKEITLAYETLSKEDERKKYDILNGIFKSSSQVSNEDAKNEQSYSSYSTNTVKEKKKQKVQRESILKVIKYWLIKLKKYKKNQEIKKPKKGDNINTEITITPEEVVTGSKRIINIRTTKSCPQCGGRKFVHSGKCPKCGGKGVVSDTKKITLTIPKGVKDGAKLRLKGEGASGKNGGPNGDVYIVVRVEAKNQMRFDKLNIYYNIPVTPFEAALGDEITIPAFDGNIKLKLPKNTSSGQKFRVAGQGVKKNGKVGDLIVTISIEFSHDLSDDELELYAKLKNLSTDNVRKNFEYGS